MRRQVFLSTMCGSVSDRADRAWNVDMPLVTPLNTSAPCHSDQALQPTHRGRLCRVDSLYIGYHKKAHPRTLGAQDISAFLTHLATQRHAQRVNPEPGSGGAASSAAARAPCSGRFCRACGPSAAAATASGRAEPAGSRRRACTARWKHVDHRYMLLYGAGLRLEECLTLRGEGPRL